MAIAKVQEYVCCTMGNLPNDDDHKTKIITTCRVDGINMILEAMNTHLCITKVQEKSVDLLSTSVFNYNKKNKMIGTCNNVKVIQPNDSVLRSKNFNRLKKT